MMQGPMPGGPGKGRLQDPFRRQTMQPQPFFGNNPPPTAPPPTTGQMGPPSNLQFNQPQPFGQKGNNPPQRFFGNTTAPQPFFGNPTSPQPDLTGSGGLGGMIGGDSDWSPMLSSADINIHGRPSVDNQGKFINNQTGEIRYGQPSQPMPYQPDMSHNTNRGGTSWGLQGPIRQESMTGNQQPLYGVTGGSFGQLNPTDSTELPERMSPTTPAYWGRSYSGGPVLQTAALGNMEYTGRGFYGGGIMDLYPR